MSYEHEVQKTNGLPSDLEDRQIVPILPPLLAVIGLLAVFERQSDAEPSSLSQLLAASARDTQALDDHVLVRLRQVSQLNHIPSVRKEFSWVRLESFLS